MCVMVELRTVGERKRDNLWVGFYTVNAKWIVSVAAIRGRIVVRRIIERMVWKSKGEILWHRVFISEITGVLLSPVGGFAHGLYSFPYG